MDVTRQPKPRQIGTVRNNIGPSLLDPTSVRNIINGNDFRKKSEIWDHILINDSRIRAAWLQRIAAQQVIEYDVVSDTDDIYVKLLNNFISMCHNDLVQNIMDARGRGISVMQVSWETIDGIICPVSCTSISPYALTITWDSTKNTYVITYESVTGDTVDVTSVFGTYVIVDQSVMVPPHQRGLWVPLSWLYSQKRKSLRDWQIASSKIGVPITVVTKPENTTDEMDAEIISAVDALDTRASIVLPYGTTVSIDDGVNRGGVTDMFSSQVKYCDDEITLVMLGQSASMVGTPGALGAEGIRDSVRIDVIDSDSIFCQHYINHIVTSYVKANNVKNNMQLKRRQ